MDSAPRLNLAIREFSELDVPYNAEILRTEGDTIEEWQRAWGKRKYSWQQAADS